MKAWMLLLLPLMALTVECGISGDNVGVDPKSGDLEIRNVVVTPTDTSATVQWKTTQQTVGTLSYGSVQATLPHSVSSNLATDHTVTLAPLDQDHEYWFQITAASPLGPRSTVQPISFRTLVSPDLNDTTAPTISGIEVIGISTNAATVTWKTDDRARGSLFFGLSSDYGQTSSETPSDAFKRLHLITLTGLTEATTYHFRVQAVNRATLSALSGDQTFSTAEPPTIAISPDTVRVSPNGELSFRVSVRNVTNLAGVSFTLAYDPTLVEILNVGRGSFYTDNQGVLFLRESEDLSRGRIEYAASWQITYMDGIAVGTLANGGGDLALFSARAIGTGASSSLRLIESDENGDGKPDTRLLDHNRLPMRYDVRNGVVIRPAN
jgi:hypothetical protein